MLYSRRYHTELSHTINVSMVNIEDRRDFSISSVQRYSNIQEPTFLDIK